MGCVECEGVRAEVGLRGRESARVGEGAGAGNPPSLFGNWS